MKVQQTQHVDVAGFLQPVNDFEQLSGCQTELGRLATRLFPSTGAFRVELHAHANHRRVTFMRLGHAQDVIQLAQFFNDDNHTLSGLGAGERQFDEFHVLKAIQHQQAVR